MIETEPNRTSTATCITAYYLILSLYLAASFFPNLRVWGISQWAQLPIAVPITLFAVGSIIPIVLTRLLKNDRTEPGPRLSAAVMAATIVIFSLSFFLLRTKTHFLGDGYGLLSLLASGHQTIMISHELGESLAHVAMKQLIGGNPETATLASYRIISITSGVIALIAVWHFSRMFFERNFDRIVFLLGFASSGYMMLFYGYVENYSLFVLSVVIYLLGGVSIFKKQMNRWLILPLQIATIFFHVLGVTLLPGTIYLLLSGTRLAAHLGRLCLRTQGLLAGLVALIMLIVFYHYYTTNYLFRFAIVPILPDRFTIEGYSMLSLKHLTDFANLIILLVPSLPIALAAFYRLPLKSIFRRGASRFLAIQTICSLGAAFIFHARLGMARDWDLFAFAGVCVTLFIFLLMIENKEKIRSYSVVVSLCIAVGLLTLTPRIAVANLPDVALRQFLDYVEFDKKKNRYVSQLLRDYLTESGDNLTLWRLSAKWEKDYPETAILKSAGRYYSEGKYASAIPLYEKVIRLNPIYTDAYHGLGACHLALGNYDSTATLLDIALGFSPRRSGIWFSYGRLHHARGDYSHAEEAWLRAEQLDPNNVLPLTHLATLYKQQKRLDEYFTYLVRVAHRDDTPVAFLKDLGDLYVLKGDFRQAAAAYSRSLTKGLDSAYVEKVVKAYPQLKGALGW